MGRVSLIWSTGARVRRMSIEGLYIEELDLRGADLRRLNAGAPVLDSHRVDSTRDVIGVVVPGSAQLRAAVAVADVEFDDGPIGQEVERMVRAQILRGISTGYSIEGAERVDERGDAPIIRVTAWTPHELSILAIGADPGARFLI